MNPSAERARADEDEEAGGGRGTKKRIAGGANGSVLSRAASRSCAASGFCCATSAAHCARVSSVSV